MTGFLNAHGSSACLYGYFIPASVFEDDEDVNSQWNDVKDPVTYDPFDKVPEDLMPLNLDELIERVELDNTGRADLDPSTEYYAQFEGEYHYDIIDWYYDQKDPYDLMIERYSDEDQEVVDELLYGDDIGPSTFFFHGENRTNVGVVHWWNERFTWPHRNYGRKQAKWRDTDGRLCRKDARRIVSG